MDTFDRLMRADYERIQRLRAALGITPQEQWRMTQEATRECSTTEDFPLSQSPNADQWKE